MSYTLGMLGCIAPSQFFASTQVLGPEQEAQPWRKPWSLPSRSSGGRCRDQAFYMKLFVRGAKSVPSLVLGSLVYKEGKNRLAKVGHWMKMR